MTTSLSGGQFSLLLSAVTPPNGIKSRRMLAPVSRSVQISRWAGLGAASNWPVFDQSALERLELLPAFDCDAEVDVARSPTGRQPEGIDQQEIPSHGARHEVT